MKIVYSLFACLALAGTSFAGVSSSGKDYKSYKGETPPPAVECFRDIEFQLDMFGSYTDTRGGGHDDGFGGGVGANFFFMRYVGVGADVNLYDGGVHGLWNYTGSLILRYPLELGSFCLAPYIFGGGGGQSNSETVPTGHVGIGLEFRITPNIGLYSEGRYTWTGNDSDNDGDFEFDDDHNDGDDDHAQARVGLRFAF